ncbi:MAG: spore maturation protein [Phycisphaerae bacterium]|nr:spore maturation protein [Phycisphaerae bacterium]
MSEILESIRTSFDLASQWFIPLGILFVLVWAYRKGVPMYESFVAGAKEGFDTAVMIIPYLVAILFVIGVFRASGAFEDIKIGLTWAMNRCGLGAYTDSLELVPLALIRPLSGGGARGVLGDIFRNFGPDSFLGMTASIMQGSTETTFYILTVYYGAVGVKRIRHTLPACLIADAVGLISAVILGYVFFHEG